MSTERMKLAEELNALLDNYLNNPSAPARDRAESRLRSSLWDNKAGIVAALRAPEADAGAVADWQMRHKHHDREDQWFHTQAPHSNTDKFDYRPLYASPSGAEAGTAADAVRECLQSIVEAKPPKPEGRREPDDHDWEVQSLEFQRIAKLALRALSPDAAPPRS